MTQANTQFKAFIQAGFVLTILLSLVSFAVAQTCVQSPPGIIAWWSLDETSGTTAADRTGNHPGGYAGAPIPAEGQVRGALRFDGNDYVDVADSNLWAFGANNFTIELWANFDAPGGGSIGHPGDIFIGNDEGPGTQNKWFFALGGGFLNFHINGPSVGSNFFPLVPFSPNVGQWYHLAITRNGSLYTIFVDGVPRGSATDTRLVPNANAPLTIGQAEQLGFMNGRLDEVTIYNRALTEEEIQAIFGAGRSGKCIDLTIRPGKGGDTGSVSVRINGSGFVNGTTVKLIRNGEPDIVGTPVTMEDDGTTLTTTFDLTGKVRGAWDVVVEVLGVPTFTLTDGFTVEEGQIPDFWANTLGLGIFRPGRAQQFSVLYGNQGNIDVEAAALWVTGIPNNAETEVSFTGSVQPLPDPEINNDELSPVILDVQNKHVIGVMLNSILAYETGNLSISLNIPNFESQQLETWSYVKDKSLRLAASSSSGCVKISCLPKDDQDALKEAAKVSRENYCSPIIFICYPNNLCRGAADNLAEKLIEASEKPGSKLAGWGIQRVRGCYSNNTKNWSHSSTKLTSLLTGREYLIDNTIYPSQICEMTPQGTNKWVTNKCHFHSGCEWVPDTPEDNSPLPCRLPEKKDSHPLAPISSFDPNAKVGAQGAGSAQYLSGKEPLRYSILFENMETATAPAQEVIITDQLDIINMDLSTVSIGSITFGNKQVVPPSGLSSFATDVDLRPDKNLIVRVEASMNPNTGLLTWRLTSIDPATGNLPTDPRVGFLPPNVNPPEGDGSVVFTAMPKQALVTGTEIRNHATIVFDVNPPINTPEWLNTLDNTQPASQVLPLAPTQASANFPVQWAGTDEGAGIKDYTIFVSEDGGSFVIWLSQTLDTAGTFTGQIGRIYAFYSVARDQAGNIEGIPSIADTTTTVQGNLPPIAKCQAVVVPTSPGVCTALASVNNDSFDPDGDPLTVVQSPAGSYNLGTTNVTLTVQDDKGASDSCAAMVTVQDTTAPAISSVSANPSVLWPPNHRMVPVRVFVSMSDICDMAPICKIISVSSNEPINDLGDGDTAPDWEITGDLTLNLRSERSGRGQGRVYTSTIKCTDTSGNSSTSTVIVTVPHNQ